MSCFTQLECLNCRQSIDQSMHRRDGCHYHSGILQPCDTWMDTDSAQDPQNYRWSCCSQPGTNRGCHWGRHQLPDAALAQRPPFFGNSIQPTRGTKRRMSDDDEEDSDSSMDGHFGARSCAMESSTFGRPFMSTGLRSYPAKLRRLDHRAGPGSMFTPQREDIGASSFFAVSQS